MDFLLQHWPWVLTVIVALIGGIVLGRTDSTPLSNDALGQEMEQWAQEERDLPERARRAGEAGASRIDARYSNLQ